MYHRKVDLVNSVEDKESKIFLDYLNNEWYHKFTHVDKNKNFFKNINNLMIKNKCYVNEIVLNGVKRKPYLDLEKVYDKKSTLDKNYKKIIQKLQTDIIKVFKTEYNKTITIDDILLLDSSGKVNGGYKLSLHIIVAPKNKTYYYTNSKYTESSAYHFYTSLINLDKSYEEELLDPQVYNTDVNFRIIGSCKNEDDNRMLKPIDSKTFDIIDLTSAEKLDYLLTYVDESKPMYKLNTPIIKQTTKLSNKISKDAPTKTDCNKKIMDLVKKYHPAAEHIKSIIADKGVLHNFNYTNRKESCPVTGRIHSGTNGFYVFEKSQGLFLKCYSKFCCNEKAKYIGYIDEIDDFLESAYQIDSKFILKCKDVPTYLDEWVDKHKVLCIKSAMATGKTYTIEHIIKTYKFKKILWITHRQSLTKSLYGKFKTMKFENYMDVEGDLYNCDRIIVQVDSLMRIIQHDLLENKMTFQKYDLVIIDEIEGCLNHFYSPYLNKHDFNARQLFNIMTDIINDSNKLLLLDADVGIRTKLFVENFKSAIVIHNKFKPQQKIFTITDDQTAFEKNIFKDVAKGKNVCVISMSSNAIERIAEKLDKLKVKYVMHTAKTDDKLKVSLEDVNSFWVKFQAVLFSPAIESGIDFNVEHFDKIYSIMRDGPLTCSQRQHLQQIGRIRHIKDNNILCWYTLPKGTDSPMLNSHCYMFDDALSYFRYYETLNGKKILLPAEYEKIDNGDTISLVKKEVTVSLFDKISLHNEVEQLNKHPHIFLTILNKLIVKADNKLKFVITNIKPKEDNNKLTNKQILIEKLMEINETEHDIVDLRKRQLKNKLSEIEKLVLKKYFFRKTFGIGSKCSDNTMRQYLEDYLDKEIYFHRYNVSFGYKKLDKYNVDTFSDGKEKRRIAIITDFVNRLTGKEDNQLDDDKLIDVRINNNQYVKAIKDISKNSIYFENEAANRALFFKKKGKLGPINKNNHMFYAKTIQAILESYNINLRISKRIRKGKKREYEYSLSVDEQIRDIVIQKK
jgi:hypothetical protein